MQSATEYRKEAEEYVRQAENSEGARRLQLLEMAQSCRRLADQTARLGSNGKAPQGV
ncbi:MAG TPA: hypothetical protein VET25_07380 [Aestuariivirgaceae bacterium]|nr:hypothetical protein [Aestuariivirgaceae bacterium]